MQPIQAKTRTIKATFSLEDCVDLYSLGCSYDLEQELINLLQKEMVDLMMTDEFKPMKIEIEEYE